MARVVLCTYGSLGDLHPSLALAVELRRRGHQAVLVTHAVFRSRVEALSVEFQPLSPDFELSALDRTRMIARVMHARAGPLYLINELVLPFLQQNYEEISAAARGADIIVSHSLTLAAPMVAEQQGIPWLSAVLSPIVYASAYDLPVPSWGPRCEWLRRLPPPLLKVPLRLLKRQVNHYFEPVNQLRRKLGLTVLPAPFMGHHSPWGSLALFSRVLGRPQPDWPQPCWQTGFCFHDESAFPNPQSAISNLPSESLPPDLETWLHAGPPPVVFTLGSAAVFHPGSFWDCSVQAIRRLGRRALLLVGPVEAELAGAMEPDIRLVEYVPYHRLMPRAALTVHHGGIGTTGQVLRAGCPMLVVPQSHDQQDNGARVRRLGAGLVLEREHFDVAHLSRALQLLEDPRFAYAARQAAGEIEREPGTAAAATVIDGLVP